MKNLISRLFRHSETCSSQKLESSQSLKEPQSPELECLEPRMLFSAAPVEAPDQADGGGGEADHGAADEAVVGVTKQLAGEAAALIESAEATQEAEQNAQAGFTAIGAGQGVNLVGLGKESGDLNRETLEAIADAAAERWRATGLTEEQSEALDSITYEIADLGGNYLGEADGFEVVIDDNGAGQGWFVDDSPEEDSEFNGESPGGYDLLSALLHEQGHVLGLEHDSGGPVTNGILGYGTRIGLEAGDAEGATPGSLEGPDRLEGGSVFSVHGTKVNEGEVANITIVRNGGSLLAETIIVSTVDGTATSGISQKDASPAKKPEPADHEKRESTATKKAASATAKTIATKDASYQESHFDYEGIPKQKVTFAPGQTRVTVPIQTYADKESEGNEFFTVRISGVPQGSKIQIEKAQVTIIDAGVPPQITSDGGGDKAKIEVAENTTHVTTVTAKSGEDEMIPKLSSVVLERDHAFPGEVIRGTVTAGRDGLKDAFIGAWNKFNNRIEHGKDFRIFLDNNESQINLHPGQSLGFELHVLKSKYPYKESTQSNIIKENLIDIPIKGFEQTHHINVSTATSPLGGHTAGEAAQLTILQGRVIFLIDNNFNEMLKQPADSKQTELNQTAKKEQPQAAKGKKPLPGSSGLIFSISGGADQKGFKIDPKSGELIFVSPPDYEKPGDQGGDNHYEVEVKVTDHNGLSDTQLIKVSVTDVETSVQVDKGGILRISDTDSESDDDLRISFDPQGPEFVISDKGNGVGQRVSSKDIKEIVINGGGGDDTLTIDFSHGNFEVPITFNGGKGGDDALALTGRGTFGEVTYDFLNENDGSIDITGNSTITYTGLEPITQSIMGDAVIFNYSSASETIDIRRVGANTVIDSTAGESVTILSPDLGLTINAGGGDDTINVDGLASGFDAALTIDGQGGSDKINYRADGVSLGAGNSATFTAEQIDFVNSDLTTTDGNITLNGTGGSGGNFIGVRLWNGDLTTGTGNIDIDGQGGATGANSQGVQIVGSSSSLTTAGGSIDIDGTGGGTSVGGHGVVLLSGATLSAGGAGTIAIDGTSSSSGTVINHGVLLGGNTSASVVDGNLTVNGTATGSVAFNRGIYAPSTTTLTGSGSGSIVLTGSSSGTGSGNSGVLLSNALITTADSGSGSVTIQGSGSGSGTSSNEGIRLANTDVAVGAGGSIDIDGTGGGSGSGSGSGNAGIFLTGGSTLAVSGHGSVDIDGTGGGGTSLNKGVSVSGGNSSITTVDGNVTIDGSGGGTASLNGGVELSAATVESTGSGSVKIHGTGASGSGVFNTGIRLVNSSKITTASHGMVYHSGDLMVQTINLVTIEGAGSITLTGTGGGTGLLNSGVAIESGSSVTAGEGSGTVDIDGTGADGTSLNNGVLISGASVKGDLSIDGTGRGSGLFNTGVRLTNATLTASGFGSVKITGAGSATGSSVFNSGINMAGGSIHTSSGNITLTGNGGTGTTLNQGIRIVNAALKSSGGGSLSLTGTAHEGTSGVLNTGVYLLNVTLDTGGGIIFNDFNNLNETNDLNVINGPNIFILPVKGNGIGGSIQVSGTGGGGTALNHGIYMQNIKTPGAVPETNGTEGGGATSKPEDGNFFLMRRAVTIT